MIENDGPWISVSCDECGDTSKEHDRDEFHAMIREAKAAGWKIENRKGQYFHTCPTCQAGDEFSEFSDD